MPSRSSATRRECRLEENAGLGLIHACSSIDPLMSPSRDIPYNLVDVHHLTPASALIVHQCAVEPGASLGFMAYDHQEREWKSFRAIVAACRRLPDQGGCHACDLDFVAPSPETDQKTSANATDLEFLIDTPLFASIPQRALLHLINCLTRHLRIEELGEKRMLTSVFMIYPEKRRQGLARLLEEFSREADRLGILMKTNETMDI